MNRLIKIFHTNGKYGFSDPVPYNSFDNVPKLIQYFTQNSLKEYNQTLDIKLSYPVVKTKVRTEYNEYMVRAEYNEYAYVCNPN